MPIEEDKLKLDLYLDMYNEHAPQARHHENLRGVISTILLSISAGIFSLQKEFGTRYHVYIGVLLIALGIFGGLISFKHYERNRLHVSTLREFRRGIDEILRAYSGSIDVLNTKGRQRHEDEYPITNRYLRLHYLWCALFFVTVIGGVLLISVR